MDYNTLISICVICSTVITAIYLFMYVDIYRTWQLERQLAECKCELYKLKSDKKCKDH